MFTGVFPVVFTGAAEGVVLVIVGTSFTPSGASGAALTAGLVATVLEGASESLAVLTAGEAAGAWSTALLGVVEVSVALTVSGWVLTAWGVLVIGGGGNCYT